jgi:hypothetical protein
VEPVRHPIPHAYAPLDLIAEDRGAARSARLALAVPSEELLRAFEGKNAEVDFRADHVAEA